MTIRLLNSRTWVALAVVVSLALSSSIVTAAAPSRSAKLSMHDLQLLANARAENKSVITLLIAAKPGANNTVAAGVQSLGGTIRYREDSVDYLRVIVPVNKVEAVAQLPGVQSVSLDEIIPLTDPVPAPAANPVNPVSAIGASTTRSGPNFSRKPFVTLNAPPNWPTSSPIRKTLGSASISAIIAWPMASR